MADTGQEQEAPTFVPEYGPGPIEAFVVSFETPAESGQFLAGLRKVRKRGVIRVLDLLLVEKMADGTVISTMHRADLPEGERRRLGGLISDLIGREPDEVGRVSKATDAGELHRAARDSGMNADRLADLTGCIPSGSAGAIVIIEHHWATRLRDAAARSGGRLQVQAMLGSDLVASIGSELENRLEAEEAAEAAEVMQLAAAMEVAQILAESELIKNSDLAETADVVAAALVGEGARAQDAVRALVEAELVQAGAADDATEAVADALAAEATVAQEIVAAMEAAQDSKTAGAIGVMRALHAAAVVGNEAIENAVDALVAAEVIEAGAAAAAVEAVRSVAVRTNLSSRHSA